MRKSLFFTVLLFLTFPLWSQTTELNRGWKAVRASEIKADGVTLTREMPDLSGWMDATVPGTVLTTLVKNNIFPDPYFGMNNEQIPDISTAGRDFYTYWFFNHFSTLGIGEDKQVWLNFRGINYAAQIYINGNCLTASKHEGMFLRERFNITKYLDKSGENLLAVLVEPPYNPGVPNGGQGGDGTIGKDVTMQFTPGWDWIQPVRDRNTGIWDKVTVEITGPVELCNTYARTRVPGVRLPGELQDPAYVSFSVEVKNNSSKTCEGEVVASFAAQSRKKKVILEPGASITLNLDEMKQQNPRLWWPNGLGTQAVYAAYVTFQMKDGSVSDREDLTFGFREAGSYFDETTGARVFTVNGQKIFIKGANWIASDAMLRLSPERYDAEIKMHADMNMNMIRVWGGSIMERPEFYDACDKYGIMVWQDLWITGDCNGRWNDNSKAESQEQRRNYPDNNDLFIRSLEDQIKMLRNHPSLFMWCGGNEIEPPKGLDSLIIKTIEKNDGTRFYLEQSTSSELEKNTIDNIGDGPYFIKEPSWFFTRKWYPFNPEIGSVGLPDIENMERIMEKKDIVPPSGDNINDVWKYHKYLGYGDMIDRFGAVKDVNDFFLKAQIIGYDQYRAIQEGYNSHMWEWYTGLLLWKSQNPWTALKGQLYDCFLDQNATYYGYRHATAPVHCQFNPSDSLIYFVNSSIKEKKSLRIEASLVDPSGNVIWSAAEATEIGPNAIIKKWKVDFSKATSAINFLRIKTIYTTTGALIDDNTYWLPSVKTDYSGLFELPTTEVTAAVLKKAGKKYTIEVSNNGSAVAFFIRIKAINLFDNKLASPLLIDDNYITLFPGEKRMMIIDISSLPDEELNVPMVLDVSGVNFKTIRTPF
jgi:mannosylglycoprotein endo-beta-mannosidase